MLKAAKWRLKKGDSVIVLSGKDKGKKGDILKVNRDKKRVIVQGVNMIKRHTKANPQMGEEGGIISREASIHISNVAYRDNEKPSRIGYRQLDDGRKVRYAKRSGEIID